MLSTFNTFQVELAHLVDSFAHNLAEHKNPSYVEAQLRDDFLNPFFAALGWDIANAARLIQKHREVEIESRTQIAGRQKRADYLFRVDRRERFVCEAKKPAEELHAKHSFQAKRYAWNKELPLAILTDFEEFKLFIVGGKPHPEDGDFGLCKKWSFRELPLMACEIWELLARESVAAGSIDKLIESLPKRSAGKGKYKQAWLIKPDRSRSLDVEFLNFLDTVRQGLASVLLRENDRADILEGNKLNEATQRILDRILFLRICEDRDIDTGVRLDSLLQTWRRATDKDDGPRRQSALELLDESPAHYGSGGLRAPKDSLWRSMVRHFRALDRRPPSHVPFFNGNLFKYHFSEDLIIADDWLARFIGELSDDESPYLFAYIPVEILGTIYERFLGKVVRPQGRGVAIEEKPEVRKAGGVYYTPRYIVEYIVAQTVEKLLADKKPEATLKLRFLDPACGSGSFLIRVFEAACEYWQQYLTDHPEERKKKWCWIEKKPEASTGDVHLTMALKRQILLSNVYGVDLDPGAVEVTQLSLYLKMLENENRNTLEPTRSLFTDGTQIVPLLPPLENNIKCGNSLIASDFSMIPDDLVRVRAFDWNVGFSGIMRTGGFDAVVGNPPYIPIETMEADERIYYPKAYPQVERKFDTGIVFILRALRLLNQNGLAGFISSITWETGENYSKLRRLMFKEKGVCEVINLPFDTFKDAYVDTGVYFLCGKEVPSYRIFRYPKKAKIDSLNDIAFVTVPSELISPPEYRLVLDPVAQRILKRGLESSRFKAFGGLTKSTQGLAGSRFETASRPQNRDWLAYGESAQAYRYNFVLEEKAYTRFEENSSLRQFYLAEPKILIRRIINRQDRLDACLYDQEMVFKKDINPFIPVFDFPSVRFLLAMINSRLISYLYVNTSAIATKDDFRQTTLAELRRMPVPIPDKEVNERIARLVEKMEILVPKLRAAKSDSERQTLQNAVTAADQQIDALVYELYGLSGDEIKIVEGNS